MSHATVLVLIPTNGIQPSRDATEEAVTELMAPYDENNEDGGKWDWWVIGGRWTGALSGYKPDEDPANISVCDCCEGTGIRPSGSNWDSDSDWAKACNGCNACNGTGKVVNFSLQPHDGDIQPVAVVLASDFIPFAILTPDGKWHEQAELLLFGETRNENDEWPGKVPFLLKPYVGSHLAVLVDFHG